MSAATEEQYTRGFEKFLCHTDEKEVFHRELKGYFERNHVRSLLDIGAGNGRLASLIAPEVSRYTAVESSTKYVAKLRARGLEVVDGEYPVPVNGSYDAVLLSHVVSYKTRNYRTIIPSAWECVEQGGILLLVTHRGERNDWSELVEAIGMPKTEENQTGYDEILALLRARGASEIRRVVTRLESQSLDDMLQAMAFVAAAGRPQEFSHFMSRRKLLVEILERRYKSGSVYSFPFTHIFICTKKA